MSFASSFATTETPPRTWRRRSREFHKLFRGRNTSTDVEKTHHTARVGRCGQKHLHGRGEDLACSPQNRAWLETPPRTWRRPSKERTATSSLRNTSTDVEKTTRQQTLTVPVEKHLHGRGEDSMTKALPYTLRETPPRTWRRHLKWVAYLLISGNTSTDVEKTDNVNSPDHYARKHLHGRGEDRSWRDGRTSCLETPPRTWRRPCLLGRARLLERNTSTDVEKTMPPFRLFSHFQKHLHGRGEDVAK